MEDARTWHYEFTGSTCSESYQGDPAQLITRLKQEKDSGEFLGACIADVPDLFPSQLPWDSIVVSQPVMLFLKTRFTWKELGVIPFSGQVQPMYRLVGDSLEKDRELIVGREVELKRLTDWLRSDSELAFYLSGDSGMGKSVLLSEIRHIAKESEMSIHSFVCHRGADLFASTTQLSDAQTPEDAAAYIFDQITLRANAPSLILIDDVQWLSAYDRKIVDRLIARCGGIVRFLLAGREVRSASFWEGVEHLPLPNFSQEAIREAVEKMAPDLLEESKITEQILHFAGGHPLLTVEVIKSWDRHLRLRREGDFDPSCSSKNTVALAMQLRRGLPSKGVCELAVFRVPFSRELALELVPDIDLELISQDDAIISGDQLEFRHVLFRLALYEQLDDEKKRAVHTVAARLLERTDLAEAAYHWKAAGNQKASAVAYEKAAGKALEQSVYARSGELANQALALGANSQKLWWSKAMGQHLIGQHPDAEKSFQHCLGSTVGLSKGRIFTEVLASFFNIPTRENAFDVKLQTLGYRVCSEIAWLNHRLEDCAFSVLRAHRSSLDLEKNSPLRLEIAATRALALGADAPSWWARREFSKIADLVCDERSPSSVRVRFFHLLYLMGTDQWQSCLTHIREERQIALEVGERKTWITLGFPEIASLSFAGKNSEALAVARELSAFAHNYGEKNLTGLGRATEACVLADLNGAAAGLRVLEENPDLVGLPQHENLAMRAGFHASLGELETAQKACRDMLLLIRNRPVSYYAFSMVVPWWGRALVSLAKKELLNSSEIEESIGVILRHGSRYSPAKGYAYALKHWHKGNAVGVERGISMAQKVGMLSHVRFLKSDLM